MNDPHENRIDLLAAAATYELAFIRLGEHLTQAESRWSEKLDAYAIAVRAARDQEEKRSAEMEFSGACYVLAETLERYGAQYEQEFDLAATRYEHAVRSGQTRNQVMEIGALMVSFRSLPSTLAAATEAAARCADTAGTLGATAALYPPNQTLEAELIRLEALQRRMIVSYRSIGDRYRRLVQTVDSATREAR